MRSAGTCTALVTGCAGFIGSHLTEGLLADGQTVIGVDCFNDNYAPAEKASNLTRARDYDRFRFRRLDLATAKLEPLLAECDVVFHLAGEPGVRTSWGSGFDRYLHNNIAATQRLLEAARKAAPRTRIVYASSSSVYGDTTVLPTPEDALPRPLSPYGVTKLSAEQLCHLYHANYGIDVLALRYFSVYGPRQRPDMAFRRFCTAILDGDALLLFGDGSQTRDFTFVADVVAATRAAAFRGRAGQAYNIGGGSRVSLARALDVLGELAERPLDLRQLRRESGDVRDTSADTTRARAELGFAPQTMLAEGLEAELDWLIGQRAALAAAA